MVLKMVSVAVLAITVGMGAAHAQSARDFRGPAEQPPASYKGQQYTDSRGCVFLRAGFGGQTNWVPRVSRDRKQLCGAPPSGGRVDVAQDVPRSAPQPVANPPMETIASTTTAPRIRVQEQRQAAAPVQVAPRVVVAAQAPSGGAVRVPTVAGNGKIGCYTNAPVAERFAVRGGGSIVMCTRGDGDLTYARAPRLAGGAAAVAASGFVEGYAAPSGQQGGRVVMSTQDVSTPPKGYKQAWDDDRLNPKRGQGTRQGWYEQDGVWTREVPARLLQDASPKAKKKTAEARAKIYISSKSEATTQAPAGAGRAYVQVGTFGQPANADGASGRLAGLGLPVARAKTSKGGKALQIVMAGPFASRAEAQAALNAARRAGFADAFIR